MIVPSIDALVRFEGSKMLLEITKGGPFASVNSVRACLNLEELHPFTEAASQPDLFELLDFCVAFYALDRLVRRPTHGWPRSFNIKYSVRNVAQWRQNGPLIREWLYTLTGDFVAVEPIARNNSGKHHQRMPSLPLDPDVDVVGLLSDGLDSLAGVDAISNDKSRRIALASVITNGPRRARIERVLQLARRRDPSITHRTMFTRLYQEKKVKEKSQRSRTVLAIALGMTVAFALNAPVVECYENGYGLLNPPIPDLQFGCMSSQILHPTHLPLWDRVSRAFFGDTIELRFPNQFRTKAEMVRDLSPEALLLVSLTRSCDAEYRKKGVGLLSCGTCGSCRTRQAAILRSGRSIIDEAYAYKSMNDEPDAVKRFLYHGALLRDAINGVSPWTNLIALQPEMRNLPFSDDGRLNRAQGESFASHQELIRQSTIDLIRRQVLDFTETWKGASYAS